MTRGDHVFPIVNVLHRFDQCLYCAVKLVPYANPACLHLCMLHTHPMIARGVVGLNCQPSSKGPRGPTEMGYPMFPPSLYRAVTYASKLGVPMYITENGCPYLDDTSERTEWINGYLGEVRPQSKSCRLQNHAYQQQKVVSPFAQQICESLATLTKRCNPDELLTRPVPMWLTRTAC